MKQTTYATDVEVWLGGDSRVLVLIPEGATPKDIGQSVFAVMEGRETPILPTRNSGLGPNYVKIRREDHEKLENENASLRTALTKNEVEITSLKEANFSLFDTVIRLSVVAEHLVKKADK